MFKLISFLFFILFAINVNATVLDTQRIIFSADIVASACHVVVDADGYGNNQLTFGTYNKSIGNEVPAREFTLRLYEVGASVQGCSAFLTGKVASLQFGNTGQLERHGVVTKGAGDGIRIDVRAIDPQASYRDLLNDVNNSISYPVDFASKGQFRFLAKPIIPERVQTGEYSGALSFVITYH